jgi:hypothetical protein
MNFLSNRELCEKLAASYVLGTLRGPAARRFARLAQDNATIRLIVSEWEARLTPLAIAVTERAPPATLWPRIEARLAASPVDSRLLVRSEVGGERARHGDDRGAHPPELRGVLVEVARIQSAKPEASYVAVLQDYRARNCNIGFRHTNGGEPCSRFPTSTGKNEPPITAYCEHRAICQN